MGQNEYLLFPVNAFALNHNLAYLMLAVNSGRGKNHQKCNDSSMPCQKGTGAILLLCRLRGHMLQHVIHLLLHCKDAVSQPQAGIHLIYIPFFTAGTSCQRGSCCISSNRFFASSSELLPPYRIRPLKRYAPPSVPEAFPWKWQGCPYYHIPLPWDRASVQILV